MKTADLPYNPEAESAVLGGIFLDNSSVHDVRELLTAEDFYFETHRVIYRIMLDLAKGNDPIDFITVSSFLKSNGQLEAVGGAPYLIDLSDSVVTSANIKHHCRLVKQTAVARKLIKTSQETIRQAYTTDNVDTLLAFAHQALQDISKSTIQDDPFKTIDKLAEEYTIYVKELNKQRFITGFPDIDAIIRGVGPKEVMYILGGPGLFKSALLHNILINACTRTGKYHPYFSLEMSSTRMFERTVQIGLGHFTNNIESGFHHHTGYPEHTMKALHDRGIDKLLICDHGGLTIDQIEHYTRLARNKYGDIGAIGIDLLGLTSAPGVSGLFELIEHNAPAIMHMAKRLNIPVIVLAHTKRLLPNEEITMESGKGSGAIEQYARFMLGLWRDKDRNLLCSVLKNTNGEAGIKFRVEMEPAWLRFNSFEPHDKFSQSNVESRKSRIRTEYRTGPEAQPW